jgi:hypothetical protein
MAGLVPAPAAGDGAIGRTLHADGTWKLGTIQKNQGTVTRTAAAVSGTELVAHGLLFQPRVIMFIANNDGTPANHSTGWAAQTALNAHARGTAATNNSDRVNCIYVNDVTANGHHANVSAIDGTNFTLNWTKDGAGLALSVAWIAFQ